MFIILSFCAGMFSGIMLNSINLIRFIIMSIIYEIIFFFFILSNYNVCKRLIYNWLYFTGMVLIFVIKSELEC
ncbi:MAG: hypothetical protein KatS3mg101_0844 [Patescibacteria group bacterium]|nr:MAG: hypothetical protein KatS3mg101_0844 [Patescibacteria group bacterium]